MTSSHTIAPRTRSWWPLALLAGALALSGCAAVDQPPVQVADGIGGTGLESDPDGIGGTGVHSDPDGIGGTGVVAHADGIGGTGVIGVVTALDAMVVNGLRIELPGDLPIGFNGRVETGAALRLGQVVEVLASGPGPVLNARRIDVFDAVVGPIEALDASASVMVVLSHRIVVDERTLGPSDTRQGAPLAGLRVGERVRVSGLRRDDRTVLATRIDRARATDPATAAGTVTALSLDGFMLGDLRVRSSVDVALRQQVQVVGFEADKVLVADLTTRRPPVPFAGGAARLVIQGVARQQVGDREVRVGALAVSVTDRTRYSGLSPAGLETGQRAVVTSTVRADGTIEADAVVADQPGVSPGGSVDPGATPGTPGAVAPSPTTGATSAGERTIDRSATKAVTTRESLDFGTADAAETGDQGDAGASTGDSGGDSGGDKDSGAGRSSRSDASIGATRESLGTGGGRGGGASMP